MAEDKQITIRVPAPGDLRMVAVHYSEGAVVKVDTLVELRVEGDDGFVERSQPASYVRPELSSSQLQELDGLPQVLAPLYSGRFTGKDVRSGR